MYAMSWVLLLQTIICYKDDFTDHMEWENVHQGQGQVGVLAYVLIGTNAQV